MMCSCYATFHTLIIQEQIPDYQVKKISHDQITGKCNVLNQLGHFVLTSVLIGDLPILCVFVQIFYLFNSLWYTEPD